MSGHDAAMYLKDYLRWRLVERFQQEHQILVLGVGYWIRGCWQGLSLSAMFILSDEEEDVPLLIVLLVDGEAEHSEDLMMLSTYSKCKPSDMARKHKANGLQIANESPFPPPRPAGPHPGELKRS